MTYVCFYGQLRDMLGVRASLPPWTTSTLNIQSGNRKCVYRAVGPSVVLLCVCVLIPPICLCVQRGSGGEHQGKGQQSL